MINKMNKWENNYILIKYLLIAHLFKYEKKIIYSFITYFSLIIIIIVIIIIVVVVIVVVIIVIVILYSIFYHFFLK